MKLSPLSIPFRSVETMFNLAWIAIVGAIGLAQMTDGLFTLVGIGGLAIGLVVAAIGWEVAYYQRFRFRLTEDTFDIDSGVLSRREREIPYDRIQNVGISRGVFQRLFGLAAVQIETAGGGNTEAAIKYVELETARRLQNELSDRKRSDTPQQRPDTAEDHSQGRPIYVITGRELAALSVVSLDFRFVVVLIVGLSALLPELSAAVADLGLAVAIPLSVIGLYLLGTVLSAIYAVTNYYGFSLFRGQDELRFERGLLQRYSGTIPLAKVQSVTISRNVLERMLGYASLLVETAGFSPGEQGSQRSAVPIAREEHIQSLLAEIEPVTIGEFERPPKRARRRYLFRYSGVVLLATAVAYGVNEATAATFSWAVVLLGLAVTPVAAHLKWRHRGYCLTDEYIITRNGFWNQKTRIIPYHRLQTVIESQTVFQRRWNLATLTIDTAGTQSLLGDSSKAVDIDATKAVSLRERIPETFFATLVARREGRVAPTEDGGTTQTNE